MDWNCAQIEERLSDSLEGRLTPEEARAFSTHVAGCANCQELAASVRELVRGMERLEMAPEPAGLARRIIDATLGPRERVSAWERWTRWTQAFWRPRLAMGAVTFAAMALIGFQLSGLRFSHLRHANLNPVSIVNTANRQAHMVYARSARFVNDLRVVYEIESRLQPQPEASPEMQLPSPQQQEPQTPGTNPQQKSENDKRRDRSQIRSAALVAMLTPDAGLAGGWTRSSR